MICTSWAWPNMFDVARGKVSLYSENRSIVNRVKLLMLTEPTELYMSPNFGVGLKKYMFRYNNDNTIAMIRDNLISQLRLWEPSVIPEQTEVVRGLEYTTPSNSAASVIANNSLQLTVKLKTKYGQSISFDITDQDIAGTQ